MRSTTNIQRGSQNNGIVILLLYLHSTIAEAHHLHFAVPSCVASHVAVGRLMPLALSCYIETLLSIVYQKGRVPTSNMFDDLETYQ